jgi:hypothetical protein
MSQNVINEQTDENIKNYLSENKEATGALNSDNENEFNFKENKKLVFLVLFLILAVVLSAAYFIYLKGQRSFSKEEVKIEIKASDEISSGEEIAFVIEYKNNTGVKLKNLKVTLFTPEKFVFISSDKKVIKEEAALNWNLDDLPAGESGKIKLFGRITGNKNSEHEFNSKISYVPSNFNYEFQSADNLSKIKIRITSVSFDLSVKCTEEIITGNEIDCLITYENISDNDFGKINLQADFPEKFSFISASAEPEITRNAEIDISWKIEEIKPKAKGELNIKGSLSGDKNEEQEIKIIMDIFGSEGDLLERVSEKAVVKIQEVPIVLKQTVNALESFSANKGEEMEYKIKFKNISDQEIKGLVGDVDFDSLEVANGSYDSESNKMTWSAFNVPKLAVFKPGDEDEVSFKIKVNDYFKIKSAEDKNFIIKNKATINSFNFNNDEVKIEKEIASNEIAVKINAFLFIRTKGYFNDDGRIKNTGVIPPEVGKETTYTIHWNLNNLLGDIKNVKIASVLPDNVKWTGNYIKSNGEISLGDENNGVYIPEDSESSEDSESNNETEENQITEERFYYNTATREIVWEMPKLNANTGLISPSKEIVYQVSIIPENSDVGKTVKIMNKVEAIGFDEFTNEEIITLESELTTELPDDYSIGLEEGIVVKLEEE